MDEIKKRKISMDIKKAQDIEGYSLKDLISATRKFSKSSQERTMELENKTGMQISLTNDGEILVRLNPLEDHILIEGYSTIIPDEVRTIEEYDEYIIRENGEIKCIRNNNGRCLLWGPPPTAKSEDIQRLEQYKEDFVGYLRDLEEYAKTTRIDLPDTNLSVLLSNGKVSLTHGLNKDSSGTFILDDGADFWVSADTKKYDSITVPRGAEYIEDMSQFLDDIKVPAENLPDFVEKNMGDKISIFRASKHSIDYDLYGHVITDYSPKKEKLRSIVKRFKSKDKGEITNEPKRIISEEGR